MSTAVETSRLLMDYEERIKQEIETMKAKRAFALQATDNCALCSLIDELCTFAVKKQMDNQMHTPDGFGGIKELKTKPFTIHCGECDKFVKDDDGNWSIATSYCTTIATTTLPIEALHAAAIALLDTIADIHQWEQEWR